MLDKEISISYIFRIINRRKTTIFISIGVVLTLVFLFNSFVPSKYEASVLLKKEKMANDKLNDEVQKFLFIRSLDEIETEMEIIKTQTILEEVVQNLKLNFIIQEISIPTQSNLELNIPFIRYQVEYLSSNEKWFPIFKDCEINSLKKDLEYFIEKKDRNTYSLYQLEGEKLLQTALINDSTQIAYFSIPEWKFSFKWPLVKIGSRVYVKLANLYNVLEILKQSIKIKSKPKTDLIEIAVRTNSPQLAQIVTNTIADVYRQNRMEQKQQTIRYSYDFIDQQLQDISIKLKEAEEKLSRFKSSSKIMKIDDNSKNLVEFLSTLQAEKLKTDLELTEYENKIKEMKTQLTQKQFFDQTYLTPGKKDESASPFSALLRELSDLELKRLMLLQRRKESHPDVVILNDQIEQIKEKLSNYNKNTITAYSIIVNSLKQKQKNLVKLISSYSEKMKLLPGYETRLAELIREKMVYEKIFTLLLDKREEMRIAELSKLQDIVIVDRAHTPLKPIFPHKKMNLAIGLLFGLVAGLVVVFIIEYRNPRITDIDQIQDEFNFPLLAIIPKYPRSLRRSIETAKTFKNQFVNLMDESIGFKEPFRVLKTKIMNLTENLEFNSLIPPQTTTKKIIMFTSCEEDSGKTTIVSNLGILFAQSGAKTLLIDCDLRKSKIAELFNIPSGSNGLIQYLSQNNPHPEIFHPFAEWNNSSKSLRNLGIIVAGGVTDRSSELLESTKMESLFKIISDYDIILVDTPPITRVVDALVLGKTIHNVVLIIKPNHTFKFAVQWAVEEILQNNMNLIGFIINGCDIKKSSYRYKYGYGYGYAYKDKSDVK